MPTNEIPAKKSLIRKQKQNYKNKQCTKNNIKNSPKLELENFKQKKKNVNNKIIVKSKAQIHSA